MKPTLICDLEVYRDYFLAGFRNAETGNVRQFELYEGHPLDIEALRKILTSYRIVTFNGNNYDLPVLTVALRGASNIDIKKTSDKIIKNNMRPWQLGIDPVRCDHIDLIEVAPGIASLKIYGGRLHCQKMQDLPIDPDDSITPDNRKLLCDYNGNDLETTNGLFSKLMPQIQLRESMSSQYEIDLRSKSDAQIAEAAIKSEVSKLMRGEIQKPGDLSGSKFRYVPPAFIRFSTPPLRVVLEIVKTSEFVVVSSGQVSMPESLDDMEIRIGNSVYRMGIGGLHSSEKSAAHFSDENTLLIDRDVASYYPNIILTCGLYPKHMGHHFAKVYRDIVNRRLAAKRAGDKVTADALKITINGSFGKFGSKYSILYSPHLLIQTTVTGQLALLMLIEALEFEGIQVVSANTDGIVIKCPKHKASLMEFVVWEWEHITGFETEASHYRALYSRDVNNYIAIKEGGGYKTKGAYAPAGLQKNPTTEICTSAVIKFLMDGTPIENTIHECQDITKFVAIRQVKGGAVDQSGEYLGKAVRWYYSTEIQGPITYKINGYKVPNSDGARPLMQLPETLPADIDYAWYINEAKSILTDIGATK